MFFQKFPITSTDKESFDNGADELLGLLHNVNRITLKERKVMIRPLGNVSDFVVEVLPWELEASSTGFIERVERLLDSLDTRHVAEMLQPEWDVALLDLKMIEAGIVHSGLTPPVRLTTLVDQLSGEEVPSLTYEDLVFLNPEGDPRLFTTGTTGKTETFFYRQHRRIEAALERTIAKMREGIEGLQSTRGINEIADALAATETDLAFVLAATSDVGKMNPQHFAAFRKYLVVHPSRGLKGPSGAFTARIPILELLLHGDELPPDYHEYLAVNWRYFPREGRVQLAEVLEQMRMSQTLVTIWRRLCEPEALRAPIAALGRFFAKFRRIHYGAVARQIPEAVQGKIAGTGGETNPGEFLRDRIGTTRFTMEEKG